MFNASVPLVHSRDNHICQPLLTHCKVQSIHEKASLKDHADDANILMWCRRPTGTDVEVNRMVPNFLKPYSHLLDKGKSRQPRHQHDVSEEAVDEDVGDAVRAAAARACIVTQHVAVVQAHIKVIRWLPTLSTDTRLRHLQLCRRRWLVRLKTMQI